MFNLPVNSLQHSSYNELENMWALYKARIEKLQKVKTNLFQALHGASHMTVHSKALAVHLHDIHLNGSSLYTSESFVSLQTKLSGMTLSKIRHKAQIRIIEPIDRELLIAKDLISRMKYRKELLNSYERQRARIDYLGGRNHVDHTEILRLREFVVAVEKASIHMLELLKLAMPRTHLLIKGVYAESIEYQRKFYAEASTAMDALIKEAGSRNLKSMRRDLYRLTKYTAISGASSVKFTAKPSSQVKLDFFSSEDFAIEAEHDSTSSSTSTSSSATSIGHQASPKSKNIKSDIPNDNWHFSYDFGDFQLDDEEFYFENDEEEEDIFGTSALFGMVNNEAKSKQTNTKQKRYYTNRKTSTASQTRSPQSEADLINHLHSMFRKQPSDAKGFGMYDQNSGSSIFHEPPADNKQRKTKKKTAHSNHFEDFMEFGKAAGGTHFRNYENHSTTLNNTDCTQTKENKEKQNETTGKSGPSGSCLSPKRKSTSFVIRRKSRSFQDSEQLQKQIEKDKEAEDIAARVREKLMEVRRREKRLEQEQEEKESLRDEIEEKIMRWTNKGWKRGNIRALLSSLEMVLLDDNVWKPVTLDELQKNPSKIKTCYRKAILIVHPDKVSHDVPGGEKLLSEMVFDELKNAWEVYQCEVEGIAAPPGSIGPKERVGVGVNGMHNMQNAHGYPSSFGTNRHHGMRGFYGNGGMNTKWSGF